MSFGARYKHIKHNYMKYDKYNNEDTIYLIKIIISFNKAVKDALYAVLSIFCLSFTFWGIFWSIYPASIVYAEALTRNDLGICVYKGDFLGHDSQKWLLDGFRRRIVKGLFEGNITKVKEVKDKIDIGNIDVERFENDTSGSKKKRIGDCLWGIEPTVAVVGNFVTYDLRLLWRMSRRQPPILISRQGHIDKRDEVISRLITNLLEEINAPLRVKAIKVIGNRRADTDAILQHAPLREGQRYDPSSIRDAIKSIFSMGFFDDIRVDVKDMPDGREVTFLVREKPSIRKIIFHGNKLIKEDKLREAINLKRYDIINDKLLVESGRRIEALYAEKGYLDTKATPSYVQVSSEAADVTFDIFEGEKALIKEIKFSGNKAFSDKTLKKLMEIKEKRPFWHISLSNWLALLKGDAGVLKLDGLERDRARIGAYYRNHGYLEAKVGKPEVRHKGKWLYVLIPIEEGSVYKIGDIKIEQSYLSDLSVILKKLKTKKGEIFRQDALRADVMTINDIFADEGFAYANTDPEIKKDEDRRLVDIIFKVDTGAKVHFSRVEIEGNTRTRDKVIRRELRIKELGAFSASALRKSKQRLGRLGYFEDITLIPERDVLEDRMNLRVKVKERPTGTFSIGAGYSSVDKLIVMGEISQRNFLGKGQTLSFRGLLGSTTNRYSLSFVEPYLMDTRLSFGVDLYNWEREYDDYTKDSTGGALKFGYPLTDDLSFYWGLRIDNTVLSDLSIYASHIIRESLSIHATRAVNIGLRYDTRDDYYLPTTGWNNGISTEYAGGILGGDSAYIKVEGTVSYYHRIWRALIGHIRTGAGYVTEGTGGRLPVYERFFLGGIDTIRGYKYGRVSPIDPDTDERIGGEVMAFMQSEGIFPLVRDMGLHGVVFFDTGNVWEEFSSADFSDVRYSVGLGIRWLSPMGPLRIEWGHNLNTKKGEEKSNWEFRMGGSF